ncbi:MAG: MMPL family transporter [Nocardioides sp.]
MSTLLYRLGRWSATHAWRVLALWLVALVGVSTLAGTLGRPLTSRVSIPDASFQQVFEQLGREIPDAAGGFGTVVLSTESGAFTAEQRRAVQQAFASWLDVPHVTRVVDPFEAQQQIDSSAGDLATARRQLDDARTQLTDGQAQLDTARGQLDFGRSALDQLLATNPDDPSIPGLRRQLADGERQLADGERQLAAAEKQLARGRRHYAAGLAQYQAGVTVQAATDGTRTVSADGRYAVAQVQFDDNAQSIPPEDRAEIPARGDAILAEAGVAAYYSVEITQDTAIVGPGEIIGLTVALLVLVLMLGSLVAAGLPLLVALLGVGVGIGGAMAFTAVTDLNTMTPSLGLMLGLAVGIDYALFIVNRHRANLLHDMPLVESVARATATAGSAVVFAGATVVIALAALVLSGLPILAEMGLVAAGTVAMAVLVAITVSPAVLRLMNTRVASRRAWRAAGFATPGRAETRPS